MTPTNDWHSIIASESHLSPDAARQLRDIGFVVVPGPVVLGGCEQLSEAYDRAVATADPADMHTGRTRSSTRINDFVNRGPEFDGIYIYPPLLAACCQIIRGPFKLSGMRARTLNPGAPTERLHVDVKHRANGWPLVGCILMVDVFDSENGATRFVPGSHLQPPEPSEVMTNPQDAHEEQVLACGPAGSVIIFNASVWHSHGANRSARPRRSIQAHFVPREAQASPDDHSRRMRPETLQRISDLAKYVLNVGTSNKPMHATCEDARA
ncbi:MAG: phytanoyl-CoA dioxygenase family protein [Pyrinomonadaceae bacterium]|nr:phytanoyl-CoA dioxygenase family protein [Pyrinomonadaceae bacterium]